MSSGNALDMSTAPPNLVSTATLAHRSFQAGDPRRPTMLVYEDKPSVLLPLQTHSAENNDMATTLTPMVTANPQNMMLMAVPIQFNRSNKENRSNEQSLNKLFAISLKRMNIVLVAIDFDQTIVATHTRGIWSDSPNDIARLAAFVRPSFVDLITALTENGLLVAIVSFSPQTSVIRATLDHVLGTGICNKLFIQCTTPSLTVNAPPIGGKENHLVAIVSYIHQATGRLINSRQILLIDDDPDNIMTALTFGHYAIHYSTDMEKRSWIDTNIACST